MVDVEFVKCNYCGSVNKKPFLKINKDTIVKCKKCGLLYVNPRLKTGKLEEIYTGDGYFNNPAFSQKKSGELYGYDDYVSDKKNILATFKKRLDIIEKLKKDKGKILDIGCATGFFLELAKKNSWKVKGVELSKYAASLAKKNGLDVFCGKLKQAKFKGKEFDVVAFFDVIEHLPDPYSELKEINRILEKNGLLVVTTPNAGSFVAKILGKRWEEFRRSREHIYFFSDKTLARMLNKSGFKVLKKETAGKIFYLSDALNRAKLINKPLFSFLGKLVKAIGLRNMQLNIDPLYKTTIYAKKIKDI